MIILFLSVIVIFIMYHKEYYDLIYKIQNNIEIIHFYKSQTNLYIPLFNNVLLNLMVKQKVLIYKMELDIDFVNLYKTSKEIKQFINTIQREINNGNIKLVNIK